MYTKNRHINFTVQKAEAQVFIGIISVPNTCWGKAGLFHQRQVSDLCMIQMECSNGLKVLSIKTKSEENKYLFNLGMHKAF